MLAVVATVFQVYVDAPPAVIVQVLVGQTVEDLDLTHGKGLILTSVVPV